MFVFKAAVVGAGTMGGQIAQVIAAAGLPVVLKDVADEPVQAGLAEARRVTEGQVGKLVERGKLDAEAAAAQVREVMDRIEGTTSYEGFGDVDLVVEAVPERMELKQAVFAELDAVTPGHAILASNTSALSIAELGEVTLRPDRVVGLHFFYPAAVMALVEVVEGDDTAPETVQAAVAFAQAIRKQPIVCAEVPGFVVNRVLMAGLSELWRAQEEGGLSIAAIDEGLVERKALPMGPYRLADLLGLDTTLQVARHLAGAYGERFHVPAALGALVDAGRLGAKSGGEGFYGAGGTANVDADAAPDLDELVERLALATLVEACLLLEEGVATHRDIDFGLMSGAGLDPRKGLMPPFLRADADGLDAVLARLERAAERHGERFAPPTVLRRLVAQGRLGPAAGQGFYAYPRPDADQPAETVKLETRGEVAIAWLANGAMNSISPDVVRDLRAVWERVRDGGVRALVIASSNPFLFCAGADVKAFTTMEDPRPLVDEMHGLLREMERSSVVTIAAVNGLAFGGGCELTMACDLRIAAQSALFGQPEVKLGIVPGFGGTQRLPRLVGEGKALEINLVGDPVGAAEAYEIGLVTRVAVDHELLDTALAWARRLAGQPPLAVQQIKRLSDVAGLDAGLEAEKEGFAAVFVSEDAREGIGAFLGKRKPVWRGR
jgi:enoyl-CoA hydratase/3-hydroxyacyl-CoA dehydrogenase